MKGDNKSISGAAISTIVPAGLTMGVVGAYMVSRWLKRRKDAPPTFSMGLPFFGPIIQFLKEPLELVRRGQKKLGECFKVNFLAIDMIFLVSRDGHEFFFTQDKVLDQAKMYSFTIPIFGPKVLYDTDYTTRMCQLRFIRERLTGDYMASYCPILQEEVVQFFREEWGDEGVVDIRDSFIECLTRLAIRCLMGEELRAKMHSNSGGHSICELLEILERGMLPLSVFLPGAPIPRHWARDAARREMSEFMKPILAERRRKLANKEGKCDGDFLWKVLTSTYPDGTPITDTEIEGFLVAAFFGGMHNSSITTSWTTLEVASRPEIVKELREEQLSTVGGPDAPFTMDAYHKMPKLRSCVKETLRMHPPLMLLMRTVEEDTKFKSYTIPRGSVVVVSPNVAHYLDELYEEPYQWKPWRFMDRIKDSYSYIPFGGGRRLCKGQEFGYLQVQCVLSYMLRYYDVEAIDGVPPETIGEGMVISPSHPCRIRYKKRVASATA